VKDELKQRLLPVGVLAAVLFVINVIGRWVAKSIDSDDKKSVAGLVAFGVIALVFAVLAVYWGRNRPMARVVADLAFGAATGCALSILVGPLLVGASPFAQGAGAFFAQIWLYAAVAGAGTLLGLIGLIAVGADYKAKQLRSFAERAKSRPRRV
jgi:hypothetical protein